jgi:long-chain acyl-CoA synthetase
VAPENLENIFCRAPLVAQCFVHGDSLQAFLVAVVVPDEEFVAKWSKQNGNKKVSEQESSKRFTHQSFFLFL